MTATPASIAAIVRDILKEHGFTGEMPTVEASQTHVAFLVLFPMLEETVAIRTTLQFADEAAQREEIEVALLSNPVVKAALKQTEG